MGLRLAHPLMAKQQESGDWCRDRNITRVNMFVWMSMSSVNKKNGAREKRRGGGIQWQFRRDKLDDEQWGWIEGFLRVLQTHIRGSIRIGSPANVLTSEAVSVRILMPIDPSRVSLCQLSVSGIFAIIPSQFHTHP